MNPLRVTLLQPELHWEDPAANLDMFSAQLEALQEATDLVVLPEMFSTGFSMDPARLAEPAGGPALQAMRRWAKQLDAAVCGSVIVEDGGRFYNRLYFVRPSGETAQYDKRHLFRMAGEHEQYAAGTEKIIVEWKGWKICPLVCYDLRFPVWSRNRWVNGEADYDVLLYVANWPARRSHPWKSLLVARAIENLSYVLGDNRVGRDGAGLDYTGDSVILDFKGEALAAAPASNVSAVTASLSHEALTEFRKSFPAWQDADGFSLGS